MLATADVLTSEVLNTLEAILRRVTPADADEFEIEMRAAVLIGAYRSGIRDESVLMRRAGGHPAGLDFRRPFTRHAVAKDRFRSA